MFYTVQSGKSDSNFPIKCIYNLNFLSENSKMLANAYHLFIYTYIYMYVQSGKSDKSNFFLLNAFII